MKLPAVLLVPSKTAHELPGARTSICPGPTAGPPMMAPGGRPSMPLKPLLARGGPAPRPPPFQPLPSKPSAPPSQPAKAYHNNQNAAWQLTRTSADAPVKERANSFASHELQVCAAPCRLDFPGCCTLQAPVWQARDALHVAALR